MLCRDFENYGINGLGFSSCFAGLGFSLFGGSRVWGLVAEGQLYPKSVHVLYGCPDA